VPRQKIDDLLDSTVDALHNTGKKLAGEKGIKAAKAISKATLGRYLEKCDESCGHCNVPCVNGTCGH
jgi:aldehyde:ferredoxin oxidoreductase